MKDLQKEIKTPPFSIISEPLSGYFRAIFLAKKLLKKLLLLQSFGPSSVLESVLSGLKGISNIEWNHNPHESKIHEIVYVPVGVEALKYVISLKMKGKIKKLIVGPNITIPISEKDIFFHPLIDSIIVPSEWVRNLLIFLFGEDSRITILPAGTDIMEPKKSGKSVVVYYKNCPPSLHKVVLDRLKKQGENIKVLRYGTFQKSDYIHALDDAKYMVYLQMSESQGLALHEAWMKDVPTFVWNEGYCKYPGIDWYDPKISAPYMSESCGMFFSSITDYDNKIKEFTANLDAYKPRNYSLQHFTNAITTKNLLNLLQ